MEKRIEKVRDEEKNNRQDLFTLSSSYLGQLKQRLNGGHMMKESEFHIPVEKDKVNICRSFLNNSLYQSGFFYTHRELKTARKPTPLPRQLMEMKKLMVMRKVGSILSCFTGLFIQIVCFIFFRKGCKRSTGEKKYTSGCGGTEISQGYY